MCRLTSEVRETSEGAVVVHVKNNDILDPSGGSKDGKKGDGFRFLEATEGSGVEDRRPRCLSKFCYKFLA